MHNHVTCKEEQAASRSSFVVSFSWHARCNRWVSMQSTRQRADHTLSKGAATVESTPGAIDQAAKRPRRPRVQRPVPDAQLIRAAAQAGSAGFQTKPLLVGVGIGAALALTAVALVSRPARTPYFGPRPTTIAGAFTKTAVVLLARVVARRVVAAAAKQGARKLAGAWPL